MKFIFEQTLLEYKKEIEKEFIEVFANGDEKYGKDLLDLFDKSKQLLLNNGISNDIQKWISDAKKDPDKVEELNNILRNLKTRQNRIDKNMDVRKRKVPGEYKILWKGDGTTLYRIDDVTASMALGVNTGWCTTGRYGHYGEPDFVPSEEDAEDHFFDHENLNGSGVGKLYYLVDDKTGYGLYAWHFSKDLYNDYSEYTKFDDKDQIIERCQGIEFLSDDGGLEKIMSEDFIDYVENETDIPLFYTEDGYKLLGYGGNSGNVLIPDGILVISGEAFSGKSKIDSVTIPYNVSTIGFRAFEGCTGMGTVYMDRCSNLRNIGDEAFKMCSSLRRISIPKSVTHIGKDAFDGCTSLKEVYYEGFEEDWNSIDIEDGNDNLIDANIYFG